MISMRNRFDYQPIKKRDSSQDDVFYTYSYEDKIIVISKHEDGSVDKYEKRPFWKKVKNSWKEYISTFDLGSVSQQVMDHITKGTPLVTAHTLPSADYTQLEKGASIKREMAEKGISLDEIVSAVKSSLAEQEQPKEQKEEKEGE